MEQKKLNLIQKKCDLMNAISVYFSDQIYLLNRKYKNNIPYEEELKLYKQLCGIEDALRYFQIDVQEMKDTNRI